MSRPIVDLGGPDGGRYWQVVTEGVRADHEDAQAAAVHARATGSVGATYNGVKVERFEPQPLNASAQAWLDAAVADGWTATPGPWNRSGAMRADDRSMKLTRDDFVVWLVDREVGLSGKEKHEEWRRAWAANGQHALPEPPEHYDFEWFTTAKGECSRCHETGDPARLKPLGFAERICSTCDTPALRREVEYPGWCD